MNYRSAPVFVSAALLVGMALPGGVVAQPPAKPKPAQVAESTGVLREISVERGLNESMAQRKLLVLVIAGNKPAAQRAVGVWAHPSLAGWAAAHAVVVKVTSLDDIKFLTDFNANPGPGEDPVVFKDGKQVRLFGSGMPQRKSRIMNPKSDPALGLLLKLDWTLRGDNLKDDGWVTTHSANMSPGVAPAADQALKLAGKSELGAIFAARVALADASAKSEQVAAAYSSLLGGFAIQDDAVFAPTRWTVLAPELAGLAADPQRKAQAVDALRTARAKLLADVGRPWYRDLAAWFDLVSLSRAIGDQEDLLRFIDDSLDDPDAAVIMPKVDRFTYEAALRHAHWRAPSTGKVGEQLIRAASRLELPKPKSLTDAEWTAMQARRAVIVRLQFARAFALCLRDGRVSDAAAIAAAAQSSQSAVSKDGATQLAMAMAALAAGQSDPSIVELVKAAGKLGVARPGVLEVAEAMAAASKPPVDAKVPDDAKTPEGQPASGPK